MKQARISKTAGKWSFMVPPDSMFRPEIGVGFAGHLWPLDSAGQWREPVDCLQRHSVDPALAWERIQFGPFELDIGGYRLTRAGKAVRLERIPMELLILIARARGQLVSREAIIQRLWGEAAFVDTENGINPAVRKIRRALGEDARSPEYIETVVGKGYRFHARPGFSNPLPTDRIEPPRLMLAVL